MRTPDGYTLQKPLRSDADREVYLATRADGTEVVLKTWAAKRGPDAQRRLQNELDVLRRVAGPGVPAAIELVNESAAPILVLECAPGVSLLAWVEADRPSIPAFLDIAIQLTAVLQRMHAAHWIHCGITPESVVVDPTTLQTCLIDFDLAQPLGAQSPSAHTPELAGTLLYVAPEQTGRMNRGIDSRSDLYSLGATLYHAITGTPPFELHDPLALIHAHMARVPRPAVELRDDLSVALSRVVQKLLEKEPENRYQTAAALLADLRICKEQLARQGEIDANLVLGSAEAPDRPRFPARLYGRERELSRLSAAYVRAATGSTQIVMLAGDAGMGKSALVHELRAQLAKDGGYLAVGKFDLSRERPYGAWVSALGGLVEQFLVESDERLEHWRALLRPALGNVAQALVDLVPELRFVLGDVPPVPALGPAETQARLSLTLARFIGVCASREHPLLLFLDDLQWSDAASRGFLEDLVAQAPRLHLLLVGAYRSSELGPEHPLGRMLARLPERGAAAETIFMQPLSVDATVGMLAAALEKPPSDVRSLADLIQRKTSNTPLFVRQFVEHIHAHGLLRYEPGTGWTWDAAAVAASAIPEGAVALMTAKLHRLEPEVRAVIELASCVGDEFDVELLCQLSALERRSLEHGLYQLCDAGLITPCPSGFRFAHDRIREASRELLSEPARARLHYEISQLLLARIPEPERPARIFEIAEHLNRGLDCVPEAQRLEAIRLNVAAGGRALAAGAAASAETFLAVGRRLLREEDWSREHALGFELLLRSAEAAFLRKDFASALAFAGALDHRPLSELEAVQVEARRIQVLVLVRGPEECTRHALAVLRRFGVRWPLRPSRLRVLLELRLLVWRLRGARIEAPLRPMRAPDPRLIETIAFIGVAAPTMARVSVHLSTLAVCWVMSSNLRRGYASRPVYTLGALATYLYLSGGDTQEVDRIERRALAEQARAPDPVYGPRMEFNLYGLLRPWREPRRKAVAPLDRIADGLHEVGDVEFAAYSRFLKILFCALAGDPIAQAGSALAELADAMRRGGRLYPGPKVCQRPYLLLAAPDLSTLEDELRASEEELAAAGRSIEPYARTVWMMTLCVHGRFELAFAQSEAVGDDLFRIVPYIHVADHCFYRGMAAAALAGRTRGAARRLYRRALGQSLRRLRRWAKAGPDFAHMVQFLEAERACIQNDERRAQSLYEQAAEQARKQGFLHHCALAHESRARLLTQQRRETEAAAALAQAIDRYREWGCEAKASALAADRRVLRHSLPG